MTTQTSVGGLWWLDANGTTPHEILNSERGRIGNYNHPLWAGPRCTTCECPILHENPMTGAALNLTTDPKPWASSAPGSTEFLGFIVEEVIGLDYSHYERTMNQRALDGSNLTPLRAGGRELTFTVTLGSTTEAGMRFGLDWLARELGGLGGRCGSSTIIMYLHCPAEGVNNHLVGRVFMNEVALKVAPSWSSAPAEGYECILRDVMFTLVANDPCFYKGTTVCNPVGAAVTLPTISLQTEICTNGKNVAQFLCGPIDHDAVAPPAGVEYCEAPVGSPLESRAVGVTLQNVTGTSGPFMIESYIHTAGQTAVQAWTSGTFLGRVGIDQISGTEGVLIDGVSGIVWSRPSSGAAWTPDDTLIRFPEGEFPFFPRYSGALSLYVLVRPYYICNGGGTFTVAIDYTSILGCIV